MHRSSNTSTPKVSALALATLVALSTLGLSACAERDEADTGTAATADDSAATTPATTAPTPAATPPGAARPGADATGTGAITEADRSFLAEALAANQHELQAAQLGLDKAQDEQVRAYAQRMQQDHSQLGTQMQPLVQQAGISMADSDAPVPELETATGESFDQAFMQMMVTDHRKALTDFERAANDTGHSAQVRSVASQAVPVLRSHLQEAEALAQQIGVELPAAEAADRPAEAGAGGSGDGTGG